MRNGGRSVMLALALAAAWVPLGARAAEAPDPRASAEQALTDARAALDAASQADGSGRLQAPELLLRTQRELDTATGLIDAGNYRHALRHLARGRQLLARLAAAEARGAR